MMAGHMRTLHGQVAEERQSWEALPLDEESWTYWMALTTAVGLCSCPVDGCPEQAAMRMAILVNFLHLHVRETVVILDKGNIPHPR